MSIKIFTTSRYRQSLTEAEDFIWDSTQETKLIEDFLNEHDRVVQFIQQNPDTPASHPQTGDQSWPFGGGRYRLFFKVVKSGEEIKSISLI